jgi:hypothetical protein
VKAFPPVKKKTVSSSSWGEDNAQWGAGVEENKEEDEEEEEGGGSGGEGDVENMTPAHLLLHAKVIITMRDRIRDRMR